jgi:hypothetical protein
VEYIALAEDDQMRQEFEEEAAQGTETELQGLVFLSPLRRAAAAAAAATKNVGIARISHSDVTSATSSTSTLRISRLGTSCSIQQKLET